MQELLDLMTIIDPLMASQFGVSEGRLILSEAGERSMLAVDRVLQQLIRGRLSELSPRMGPGTVYAEMTNLGSQLVSRYRDVPIDLSALVEPIWVD